MRGGFCSLSLALVTIGIYLWLRAAGLARTALVSASLFIATFIAYAPSYVGVHPQLTGHAFSVVAAGCILWRRHFSPGALAAAALLTVLGAETKHLLIPFPLALTVWMVIYRRDCLARWLGFAFAFLLVALAIIAWRHATFFHTIAVTRTYSTHLATKPPVPNDSSAIPARPDRQRRHLPCAVKKQREQAIRQLRPNLCASRSALRNACSDWRGRGQKRVF